MKATITIQMDNDAFATNPGAELARILRELAEKAEWGNDSARLMDSNGNHVGDFTVSD